MNVFRLGIVTDVHGDVHALADALAQIDRLGCDQIVCCGDVVDYGLFPDETIDLLAGRRIPTVRGNHDRWAIEGSSATGGGWDLSKASRRFLASLPTEWRIEHGGLSMNLETYQASIAGRVMDLTYMEYELLRFLATNPNRVFTRETLLSRVWGYEYYGGARTVDVHVRRLRAKLGEENANLIQTVRSVGYKFGTNAERVSD